MTEKFILTMSCPNQRGIVSKISTAIFRANGDILEADQYDDTTTASFFMRVVFDLAPAREAALQSDLGKLANDLGMQWELRRDSARQRVLLLVSKFDHCLVDLLYRWRIGELKMDIAGIVSNHPREVFGPADFGAIPFHHLPVTKETKGDQERQIRELVEAEQVDLVVLARYMQILSDEMAAYLSGRCINIHHSFLPGFKGAKPYHQAHSRGVKLIGATAHYVTADLDEGPIVEQDVERVSHSDSPEDLVRKGRDIERRVLARALSFHLEGRALLNGSTTVVFRIDMAAALIDGAALARRLNDELKVKVEALAEVGVVPRLAVILVGDDPASHTYVRSKSRAARSVGIDSVEHRLDSSIGEAELLALVDRLNHDPDTDGILIQLPLPRQIDVTKVLRAVHPAKDVDGFHPTNVGERVTGAGGIVPCTPMGAMFLIETVRSNIEGLDAVVIGMSNIVGKPMADLLLSAGCTVTVAHIKTVGLPAICRRADIVVVAVGKPGLVRAEWIKPGAIVIDVGINRIVTSDGENRLVGDVAFEEAAGVAGAITPVPGGVGPMTIACLLLNTFQAALGRRGAELRAG